MRFARRAWLPVALGIAVLATTTAGCTLVIDGRLASLGDGGAAPIDAQPGEDAGSDDAGPADAPPDAPIDAFVPSCTGVTCDANEHCELVAEAPTCVCDTGWVDDGSGTCVDVDECETGALTCDASAVCRNAAGSAACVCLPGTTGDGATCAAAHVLLWTDTFTGSDAVARAVMAAGFRVTDTHDDAAFGAAIDAGGVDLVIVAASTSVPGPDAISRLTTWADGGGKLVISVWNLNSEPAMAAIGQVSTTSFNTPRQIHADPMARPNLFDQQGRAASPIVPVDTVGDDGDVLSPTGFDARVLARFDSAAGPAAILLTRAGQVIVNGFTPAGVSADGDADGLNDYGELIQNEVNFLLRPRVLMYYDDFEIPPSLPGAIAQLGWTRLQVTSPTDFPTAYDAGGFDALAIQSGSNYLEDPFQTRLFDWVSTDRPALFSYWDLDGSDRPTAAFRNALEVSTVTRDTATPVVRDPAASIDLFRFRENVPDTLTPTNDYGDNGDELTPTQPDGVVVARFATETGPGAVVVTRDTHVVVNGFLPVDFTNADGDADTIPDTQELYVNELLFLMAR